MPQSDQRHPSASPLSASPSDGLEGTVRVPGDKSISHRALMIGALAVGETRIEGLLEGEDVLATAAAMRALGAEVERGAEGVWSVWGRGIGGLVEPAEVLDLGNSGTGARLLLGVLASHPLTAVLTGDASLRGRPMGRVAEPLREMGAQFFGRENCRLPLTVLGAGEAMPISYTLPVASAQVKSAILLAGLNAPGATSVIEPQPTRDHTERMLRCFGATLEVSEGEAGRVARLEGQPELSGRSLRVPADVSSAAFPLVAAAILPGSRVTLSGVGMNPHRTGLIETLKEMGARIALGEAREEGGEPLADLTLEAAPLEGIEVPAARAPSMIDEYPILAVAAACARGRTVMRGLSELRVKESDRLSAVARGLAACGIEVEEGADSLVVHGKGGNGGGRVPGGATIAASLDHRIAMSFLVLGLAAEAPVTIDDASPIETSFPGFSALMTGLGAKIGGAGPGPS